MPNLGRWYDKSLSVKKKIQLKSPKVVQMVDLSEMSFFEHFVD